MHSNKIIALVFSFLIISFSGKAQDLIVTTAGDSIQCDIDKVTNSEITFSFVQDGKVMNTMVPLTQVVSYAYNYSGKTEYWEQSRVGSPLVGNLYSKNFRLSANAGWAYRFGKVPTNLDPGLQEYLKELKTGYFVTLDFAGYISQKSGIGGKFAHFGSKNSVPITLMLEDGSIVNSILSDDVSINIYALYWARRFILRNGKDAFYFNLGLGGITYNNVGFLLEPITLKGISIALVLDFDYDIALNDHISIGFHVGYNGGVLSSYKETVGGQTTTIDLPEDSYESLARIDLGGGIKINF